MGDVYKSVIQKSEGPYREFLPRNFGYGIGMTVKEELLCFNSENTQKVEAGMCFNIRVSLSGFNKEGGSAAQNCLLIADTILVLDLGAEILTRGITRVYGDISYFLDDLDEEETAAIEEDKKVKYKQVK